MGINHQLPAASDYHFDRTLRYNFAVFLECKKLIISCLLNYQSKACVHKYQLAAQASCILFLLPSAVIKEKWEKMLMGEKIFFYCFYSPLSSCVTVQFLDILVDKILEGTLRNTIAGFVTPSLFLLAISFTWS